MKTIGLLMALTAVASGCAADHTTAPAAQVSAVAAPTHAVASFTAAPERVAMLAGGIEDAKGRLLPAVGDGEKVKELGVALNAVADALDAHDATATAAALADARAAITAVGAEKGLASIADLTAIELLLNQVEKGISVANDAK